MPTGDDPYQALVSQFLTTSILVIPTGLSKGTDAAGHPYFEAAWVPILCVDTATATSTYCNDTGSDALPGSVEVRSAVIGSTGNLVTVDVQQKGSQLYAQQKYGYHATGTQTLSFYTFESVAFGFFGFVRHTVSISVPLFLNPDGSTTFDDTGVPDIVEADYGSSGAVALYLDSAGHETTQNTGLPALVLPGASYAHVAGPSVAIYVNPSFQYVTTPWGPNLLSDGDFSQSVPSNGAANGWTSTNIDGNGGWRPDYFILNSNGSASSDPTISQSLTVNPGVQYQIGLYVTNVYPQYGGSSPNAFEVAVNGQVVATRTKAQANGWLYVTTYWTAGAGTTSATLSLIGEHGDDSSFAVTDVSLQAQNTPAYVTDWAHGSDLYIDGSGREVTTPTSHPSTVPVYATELTPFVRTADITASSLGGVALSGHDSLDIEATSTSSATTTVESFTVPVDQLSAGQPVMYTVNSDGLRAAVPGTAQTYFGGEPVVDPLTGKQLYYSGGEPVLDVFTGQPVKDPNGITLTHPTCTDTVNHVGCDPMLHIAGEPVVQARGSVVDYLGGEQVFDENGNPVYTGSQPFTYEAGTAEIVNRGQTVYELEQNDGSLVTIDATSFSSTVVHAHDARGGGSHPDGRRHDRAGRPRVRARLRRHRHLHAAVERVHGGLGLRDDRRHRRADEVHDDGLRHGEARDPASGPARRERPEALQRQRARRRRAADPRRRQQPPVRRDRTRPRLHGVADDADRPRGVLLDPERRAADDHAQPACGPDQQPHDRDRDDDARRRRLHAERQHARAASA